MLRTKTMIIRLATNKDHPLLAEMNYQLIKDEGHSNPMNLSELQDRMTSWLQGDYSAALIDTESEIVGYALWRIKKKHIYIRQFFVQPEHRQKHTGSMAIQLLKQNHWKGRSLRIEVLINNYQGHSFWQSVGFEDYCLTMDCNNV